MPKYVPRGYSQTRDYFAWVLVWSPQFAGQHLSFDEARRQLQDGIDTVLQKAKDQTAIDLLVECKREVGEAQELFRANTSNDPDTPRFSPAESAQ